MVGQIPLALQGLDDLVHYHLQGVRVLQPRLVPGQIDVPVNRNPVGTNAARTTGSEIKDETLMSMCVSVQTNIPGLEIGSRGLASTPRDYSGWTHRPVPKRLRADDRAKRGGAEESRSAMGKRGLPVHVVCVRPVLAQQVRHASALARDILLRRQAALGRVLVNCLGQLP